MELLDPEIEPPLRRRRGPKPLSLRAKFAASAWLDGEVLWRQGRVVWRLDGRELAIGPRELDATSRALLSLGRHPETGRRERADFDLWHARRIEQLQSAQHLAAIRAPDWEALVSISRRRNPAALERLTGLLLVESSAAEPLPHSPARALFEAWPLSQKPLQTLMRDENQPMTARALAALIVGASSPLEALPGEPGLRRAARYGARNGFPCAPQLVGALLQEGGRDAENSALRVEAALQHRGPLGFDEAQLLALSRAGKGAALIAECAEAANRLPDPFPSLLFAAVTPKRLDLGAQQVALVQWKRLRDASLESLRGSLLNAARGGQASDFSRFAELLNHWITEPVRALGALKIERDRMPRRHERDLPAFDVGAWHAVTVALELMREVAAAPEPGALLSLLCEALPRCAVCPAAESATPARWAAAWHRFAQGQSDRVFAPLLQLARRGGLEVARQALRLDCWRELSRQRDLRPELLPLALELVEWAPAAASEAIRRLAQWDRFWGGIEDARAAFAPLLRALCDVSAVERALWLEDLLAEIDASRRGVRCDLPALSAFVPAMRRAKSGSEIPRWVLVETAHALRKTAPESDKTAYLPRFDWLSIEMARRWDAATSAPITPTKTVPHHSAADDNATRDNATRDNAVGEANSASETATISTQRDEATTIGATREAPNGATREVAADAVVGNVGAVMAENRVARGDDPSWAHLSDWVALACQIAGADEARFRHLMAAPWRYVNYDNDFEWPDVNRGAKLAREMPALELALADNFARCPARGFAVLEKLGPLDRFDSLRAPLDAWRRRELPLLGDPAWLQLQLGAEAEENARRFIRAQRLLAQPEAPPTALLKICAWPRKIEAEIAALESRGSLPPNLAKRLENLRARIENRAELRAAMHAETGEALRNAMVEAELQAIEGAVESCYRDRLEGLGAPKNLVLDADWLNAALFSTDIECNRKWLREIVRAQSELPRRESQNGGDWRLAIEGNAKWLRQQRERGLSSDWLAEAPRGFPLGGGRVELKLESSPLKILQMGNYFGTCLSRGGINAHSSVANAVELNKRVVFARDAKGRVVGRQLLAMSSEGKLLGFHVYTSTSPENTAALLAAFGEYARDFAARCGVELGNSGEVERLFVSDWYDDGAIAWSGLTPVAKTQSKSKKEARMTQKKLKPPVLTGRDAHIARLNAGETVSFREGGNSMTPRIKSRQKCTYAPVQSLDDIRVGDAVFCRVGSSVFTHLVSAIQGDRVQISNNHGHVNGWTNLAHIYGKVVKIEN